MSASGPRKSTRPSTPRPATPSRSSPSHARALTTQFAYFLLHSYSVSASGPGRDNVVTVSTGQSALVYVFYRVVAAKDIYSAASPSGTPKVLARGDLRRTALEAAENVLVLTSYRGSG
ncbi:hypothetical protein TOPH_08632 [Tolypocladium ophioglossoides CBS 100239]|uniref:Uncharacterized protein n=1 Tax=Tolypocladium ophioglossoides (strain CBS 100239) TaxID=1163406 RepID=A0A0L0MY65_TOLOC|nr:hypothetical protein TOPH_08632 [Tolypocladium ophioglossoides CBS 100239]